MKCGGQARCVECLGKDGHRCQAGPVQDADRPRHNLDAHLEHAWSDGRQGRSNEPLLRGTAEPVDMEDGLGRFSSVG